MQSIYARAPKNVFISVDEPQGVEFELSDWTYAMDHLNKTRAGGSALIIQDVDVAWADRLLVEFPDSLSDAFFAKHMIRLDSCSIVGKTAQEASINLKELRASLNRHWSSTVLDYSHSSGGWLMVRLRLGLGEDGIGLHVHFDLNGVTERSPGFPCATSDGGRWDVFERCFPKDSHWRSMRTRVSWCRLASHVCKAQSVLMDQSCSTDTKTLDLVLVGGTPDISKGPNPLWNTSNENPFQGLLSLIIGSKPPWKGIRSPILVDEDYTSSVIDKTGPTDCVKTTVKRMLQQYTPDSVFDPQDVPSYRRTALFSAFDSVFSGREVGMCHVFAWSLAASSWELIVAAMESNLQHIQRNATMMTNDEAFRLFKEFRRQVADAEILTAEFKERLLIAIKAADKWYAHDEESLVRPARFWGDRPIPPSSLAFGRTQPVNISNFPDILTGLEARVNAMTQTVNEEIQVVIGSVQVEDAKIMKRQTEVTVVLGVLAAIYLPLTLVTGIFGMNINEVNEGVPDWIWVVKVWSWIFSVTIIPILIYGMVRLVIKYCRARREKMMGKDLDFEAQKLD